MCKFTNAAATALIQQQGGKREHSIQTVPRQPSGKSNDRAIMRNARRFLAGSQRRTGLAAEGATQSGFGMIEYRRKASLSLCS